MNDKYSMVRNYILGLIESGEFKSGEKLPTARNLSGEIGAAFAIVQNAITSLAMDGVLESVPRKGVYVRDSWKSRVLNNSVWSFYSRYPWGADLSKLLHDQQPGLRTTKAFDKGMFEIRTTLEVQRFQNDYMDLSDIFKEVCAESGQFFSKPFEAFTYDSKMPGIPFIYSPRVMFYNISLFKEAGCTIPGDRWTWDEFIECVKKLSAILPGERIYNWRAKTNMWMNYILRAGGSLIDKTSDDIIKLDDPKTQDGLACYSLIRELIGIDDELTDTEYMKLFADNKAAIALMPRQVMPDIVDSGFDDWGTTTLPIIPGGEDISTQATDVLCVRKECIDKVQAKEFIKTMLSEEVQDFIGSIKYGIPIRKSSAQKSIDFEDARDMIFINESSKMSAGYNLETYEISNIIEKGIGRIWSESLGIKEVTSELANVLRTLIKIDKNIV